MLSGWTIERGSEEENEGVKGTMHDASGITCGVDKGESTWMGNHWILQTCSTRPSSGI